VILLRKVKRGAGATGDTVKIEPFRWVRERLRGADDGRGERVTDRGVAASGAREAAPNGTDAGTGDFDFPDSGSATPGRTTRTTARSTSTSRTTSWSTGCGRRCSS
jgi:hypothetical protein